MGALAFLTARPVAHRGLHDAEKGILENAPSAVDAAVAAGFAIEVDVQRSADGEAMVFHDSTLERMTQAHGPLSAHTAQALQAVAFKGTADRMMRLTDLFTRVGGRVPLVIEIKSDFSGDTRLAVRTAQLVAAYDGPAALMSFDPQMIACVRETAPRVPRGVVAQRQFHDEDAGAFSAAQRFGLGNLLHWPGTRFQFVAYKVADLHCNAPRLARTLGFPLLAWTVRTAEDRAEAARFADQIIFEGFRPDAPGGDTGGLGSRPPGAPG